MNIKEIFDRMTVGRAVIVGLVILAFYYFMFYDDGSIQEAAIQSAQGEIQKISQEIAELDQKIESAKQYQLAAKELGASIQRLLDYIPAQFRMGQLMKVVSDEARVAGLDITRLNPKSVQNPNRYEDFTELGVTLSLEGQYDQILSFMSSLTRQRQIFIFDKLEMTANTKTKSELVEMTADIHAFSYNGANKNNAQ